ncbi:hypothetical protein [Ruminiclostridium josui]|uniref:hypothetical protein n=1 Tax=Ruminiclostridium josui TaxID=1499 RepID=UPI0004644532|nr:hypothetical protein [Ruminiclostridium josui]
MLKDDLIFPPALAIGYINEQEVRIINLDKEKIQFESADKLEDPFQCRIKILNFKIHAYEDFILDECKIIGVTNNTFSYIYKVKIGSIHTQEIDRYYEIIDKTMEFFEIKEKVGVFRKIAASKFLGENYETYPYEKDTVFSENIEKQRNDWYSFNEYSLNYSEFADLMQNLDLAFNINSLKLFKQFEDQDFDTAIEANLDNDGLKTHGIFSKSFSRVYIGNEFCSNIFPNIKQLLKLMNKAYESNFDITLAFPFINENYNGQLTEILNETDNWCKSKDKSVEILVNDWGMLELLKKYSNLKPVIGRLLNRRKKDPRLNWWWGYNKNSDNLKENSLNTDHFIKFIKEMGISRLEYESSPGEVYISKGKHSMHFPFYQINTSPFCLLYAHCNLKMPDLIVSGCPNYCSEFYLQYPEHLNMIGKGNSIFGFHKLLFIEAEMLKKYIEAGIDRLVYSVS